MERLTVNTRYGAMFIGIPPFAGRPDLNKLLSNASNRLAAYEDTGLEPSEVYDLQMKISLCTEKAETIEPEKMPFILYAFKRSLDDLAVAQAELDRLKQANRWIPVTEQKPGDKEMCLCFSYFQGHPLIDVHAYCLNPPDDWHREKNAFWDYDSEVGFYVVNNITHWRPLPEPPKEDL